MEVVKMEETAQKEQQVKEEQKSKKLTYEQLVEVAKQMSEQYKQVVQENQTLKQAVNKLSLDSHLKEVECVLKCLDHIDLFSTSFIESVVKRIEEIFTPSKESEEDTNTETEEK